MGRILYAVVEKDVGSHMVDSAGFKSLWTIVEDGRTVSVDDTSLSRLFALLWAKQVCLLVLDLCIPTVCGLSLVFGVGEHFVNMVGLARVRSAFGRITNGKLDFVCHKWLFHYGREIIIITEAFIGNWLRQMPNCMVNATWH